jgi:anti-sigma-K factor RskA
MMAYSEDHIALAAEYALGTLDADERAQVETMMAVDTEYTALVHAWEYRLGVLNQMVGSVEPRPIVWENIKAAIGHSSEQQAPLVLPEAPPPPEPAPPPAEEPVVAEAAELPGVAEAPPAAAVPPVAVDNSNVVQLAGRVRRLRSVASIATALAAALVAMLAVQVYRPELLPEALRPKPRIQTVEVKTPAPSPASSAQYVALLQRDGGSPAFILTVDAATKNFTVRKVGADAEPGKSFELWLISDKLPQPRSLGVIGGSDFTARPVLADYDAGTINAATYAVTVEPAGGSPTGKPTSAPIYVGKLIETVPATR